MIDPRHARLAVPGPLGFKALAIKDGRVRSALAAFVWQGRLERMAICARCSAGVPSPDCTCGFHASYSAGHVLDQYGQYAERFLVLVEGQGQVILHELGWRAECCAVHAIVELYTGNIVKHMQLVRAARCLGNPPFINLEDAISVVQDQQRRLVRNGDWEAGWTDPRAYTAAHPAS